MNTLTSRVARITGTIAVAAGLLVGLSTGAHAATNEYTAKDVSAHNTAADCWTIVDQNVYDLTKMTSAGGPAADGILPVCGKNGTDAFTSQYGPGAGDMLTPYKVGTLVAKHTPASYTIKAVAKHNKATNCWVIVKSGVYDLTKMTSQGGPAAKAIVKVCGKNGTGAFTAQYGPKAGSMLAPFKVGVVKR